MNNSAVKRSKISQRNERRRKKGINTLTGEAGILRKKRNKLTIDTLIDPFAGSGTTLLRKESPSNNNKVNIKSLKVFALELPDGALKSVLLSELSEEMDVSDFISRLPIWIKLARM
jgi:hypothetical protein